MVILWYNKHEIHKDWKFGFHKRLANRINSWVCTKYRCNAYIKTDDLENEVIFEHLTHRYTGEKDVNFLEVHTKRAVNPEVHLVPDETSLNIDCSLQAPSSDT